MDTAEDLHAALRELDSLDGDRPLLESIQQAVDSAAAVFNVAGAGVMFIDDSSLLHYAAASDGHGRELEHAEISTGTGPCVQAVVTDSTVTTEDVTVDGRWPRLHAEVAGTNVRAVIGVPIRFGGTVAGSLDAYCDSEHTWDESEIAGLEAYARVIERLLLTAMNAKRHERTVEQLEYALEHRVVIERAVGVLMERHGEDAVTAFERLRTTARNSRRRAAEVAHEILGTSPAD